MKLVFENQSSWQVNTLSAQLPITDAAPAGAGITVFVRPLDPLLNFWGSWKTAMLEWGVPARGKLDIVTETKAKTIVEWPIEIIDTLVKDAAGTVVEARITVLYFFLEYCCMAVACGPPERIAAEREKVLAVFTSGRPDWSGAGIAAIAQLYT